LVRDGPAASGAAIVVRIVGIAELDDDHVGFELRLHQGCTALGAPAAVPPVEGASAGPVGARGPTVRRLITMKNVHWSPERARLFRGIAFRSVGIVVPAATFLELLERTLQRTACREPDSSDWHERARPSGASAACIIASSTLSRRSSAGLRMMARVRLGLAAGCEHATDEARSRP
jgi:hypothetical protein